MAPASACHTSRRLHVPRVPCAAALARVAHVACLGAGSHRSCCMPRHSGVSAVSCAVALVCWPWSRAARSGVSAMVTRRTLGCVGHIARQRARVCRPCHAPRRSGVGRGHAPHAWVCRPCRVLCAALGCVGGVGRVVWRARSCVSAVSHTVAPASRAVVVNVSCEEKRKKVKQKRKRKQK